MAVQTQHGFVPMLINGEGVEAASGVTFPIENPARQREQIATVPRSDASDVDRAVQAAAEAFKTWRKVAPAERGAAMLKIAQGMRDQAEEIATTIATETGNAIRTQARGEVKSAVDIFQYFGGVATELKGEVVPISEDLLVYNRREPIGVVGAIIPWNAPVMLGALRLPWLSRPAIRWS